MVRRRFPSRNPGLGCNSDLLLRCPPVWLEAVGPAAQSHHRRHTAVNRVQGLRTGGCGFEPQGRCGLQVARALDLSFLLAANQSPDTSPNLRLMLIRGVPWPTGPPHQARICWRTVMSGSVSTQLVPTAGSVIKPSAQRASLRHTKRDGNVAANYHWSSGSGIREGSRRWFIGALDQCFDEGRAPPLPLCPNAALPSTNQRPHPKSPAVGIRHCTGHQQLVGAQQARIGATPCLLGFRP